MRGPERGKRPRHWCQAVWASDYRWSASRSDCTWSSSTGVPVAGTVSRPSRSTNRSLATGSRRSVAPSTRMSTSPGPRPMRSRRSLGITNRPALSMVVRIPREYHLDGYTVWLTRKIPSRRRGDEPAPHGAVITRFGGPENPGDRRRPGADTRPGSTARRRLDGGRELCRHPPRAGRSTDDRVSAEARGRPAKAARSRRRGGPVATGSVSCDAGYRELPVCSFGSVSFSAGRPVRAFRR